MIRPDMSLTISALSFSLVLVRGDYVVTLPSRSKGLKLPTSEGLTGSWILWKRAHVIVSSLENSCTFFSQVSTSVLVVPRMEISFTQNAIILGDIIQRSRFGRLTGRH